MAITGPTTQSASRAMNTNDQPIGSPPGQPRAVQRVVRRRPASGPDNRVQLGSWRVLGAHREPHWLDKVTDPESDSTEDSRGNRVQGGRILGRQENPYGGDEPWPLDVVQANNDPILRPDTEAVPPIAHNGPPAQSDEDILTDAKPAEDDGRSTTVGGAQATNPPASPSIPAQAASAPDQAGPQPGRQNPPARLRRARAEGHAPNAPGGRPRPDAEYYVNGIRVAKNDPCCRPRTGVVPPTRGLTLEGFLANCRIDQTDWHTRVILRENRVVDWPFFLRSNESSLRDMGLFHGAARALCQGAVALQRRAAQNPYP
ncbi:hypothetical protein PTTG_26759 [Puccinia triticina 1-1 BBBD Race 1]|uniref:Uncharacterized protein n=1 Tax=Puccinia triticina (isolate 1-1 / race 1 (BBBD)) TaxID=630390 RepID=A0A180GQS1_PUCT1|nr:hypothetical protein PTTG_26759 [Puccinia triticina 1-1 BBBD Race 1]